MEVQSCRICGNSFFTEPLLEYKNMPKSAQFLPDGVSIENDGGITLKIYQCSGCGLIQLSNDPVFYYKDVIRASAFSEEMKQFRIKQFRSFVKKYSLKNKKVIEVGCGRGEYLMIMRQFGVDLYGIEHYEESAAFCQKNNLNVLKGFIEDSYYVINYGPFDAFYILNFFEHLPNPSTVLRGIYNNLADNAVGLIEVPNLNMILRKKLFSEFTIDHLLYFTKESLSMALELNGFELIEINEIWYDYIISAVVKKRNKLDLSSFNDHQMLIKKDIEDYINSFGGKKVAIWGAGHQALAVMSLADLKDKIKCVIDSAVFKQGKYTPVTHIPIVSPDVISSETIDAVIVMAAGYSDEVVNNVKQKNKNIKIAVLRDFGLEYIE